MNDAIARMMLVGWVELLRDPTLPGCGVGGRAKSARPNLQIADEMIE
jgi:hypothetical protein